MLGITAEAADSVIVRLSASGSGSDRRSVVGQWAHRVSRRHHFARTSAPTGKAIGPAGRNARSRPDGGPHPMYENDGRCLVHNFEMAEARCRNGGNEFCNECLVYAFGATKPPYCVACALAA